MDKIDELLSKTENLPPAPALLPKLLLALTSIDSDIKEVVEMITVDPALTAKVLQVCNNAYYGYSQPANNVAEAVNRLGFHGVYHIVAVVSGGQLFKPEHTSARDVNILWKHSVTSAFSAQLIGESNKLDSAFLFTAGLLHDTGKIPLSEALAGDYAALVTDAQLFGRSLVELEQATFEIDHAEVGGRLLEQWKFSPEFISAVRFHHAPAHAGEFIKLAATLELADYLAHSIIDGEEPAWAAANPAESLGLLGVSEEQLSAYRESMLSNFKQVEAMCAA